MSSLNKLIKNKDRSTLFEANLMVLAPVRPLYRPRMWWFSLALFDSRSGQRRRWPVSVHQPEACQCLLRRVYNSRFRFPKPSSTWTMMAIQRAKYVISRPFSKQSTPRVVSVLTRIFLSVPSSLPLCHQSPSGLMRW